ncbi:hypothetical protein [Massilia sp. S19_KUP03_FR1]|uniref:hypothetical protein n=1 Tax=Massilia sp. S19_KUP03_FR1 TaxID=3025503 RepID=UPI002FCD6D46
MKWRYLCRILAPHRLEASNTMRFNNIITIISIALGVIINVATDHSGGWSGIGYSVMFGVLPLLALLALLIISCLFSTLTKTQKLVIAIGFAYALLIVVIISGTRPPWTGFLFPSAAWLLPLLVWNFLLQWFRHQDSSRRSPSSL